MLGFCISGGPGSATRLLLMSDITHVYNSWGGGGGDEVKNSFLESNTDRHPVVAIW
jgi:hypothetical protein